MTYYIQLQKWCAEGRSMPGYQYGYGAAYIAYLLGLYDAPQGPPATDVDGHGELIEQLEAQHQRVLKLLEGPHGWTILKTLIARKAETLTDEENSHG